MELFSLRKIHRICPLAPAHGSTDFIQCLPLAIGSTAQIKPIESVSRLFLTDMMAETAGSSRWRHRLSGVCVFSSYGGRFSMRFAPTGSQWWGERVYANLNRRRAATEPSNGEVAQPVLVDGEGGLRWSFGSKDMRQGFLELPSSFSTDQFLRSAVENSNLVAT
jgi:hypothetical protein